MSDYHNRKSSGMTLLRHLAARAGRAKKKNPNGVVGITIADVEKVVEEFKQIKFERDEAMKLLGLRDIPVTKTDSIKSSPVEPPQKIDARWKKVLDELS